MATFLDSLLARIERKVELMVAEWKMIHKKQIAGRTALFHTLQYTFPLGRQMGNPLTPGPLCPMLPFPRGEFRIISFCPERRTEKWQGQGRLITGPGQEREKFCSGKEVSPFFQLKIFLRMIFSNPMISKTYSNLPEDFSETSHEKIIDSKYNILYYAQNADPVKRLLNEKNNHYYPGHCSICNCPGRSNQFNPRRF
jgi:hypothetical protein